MDRKTHGIYSMAQASTAGLGTDPLKTGGHYCPQRWIAVYGKLYRV
jgi:hypothetical protein